MIHITPPMSTPEVLSSNPSLANPGGFLTVDKETLQHTKYVCILISLEVLSCWTWLLTCIQWLSRVDQITLN